MKKIKQVLEYVLLRLLSGIIRVLPLRLAFCLAWVLAWFSHQVIRFRVQSARQRIRQVFGERFSRSEVNQIAWISWRNLCFTATEVFRMQSVTKEYISSYMETDQLARLQNVIASGKGAILCVPHMGNWELGGLSAHLMGIPFFFIARRQKNPLTDAYLNKMRQVTGADTMMSDDQGMLRNAVKRLKRGMVFAILPDVRSRTPALKIPYLNGEANIAQGMALFAHLANVPVVPAHTRRVGWFRHVWSIGTPVYPDKTADRDKDLQRMTEIIFNYSDQAIQ
ncbi:MAG: lysophospholipid acyltransferase family protein [Kiritimatiellae bacterium]|nr:lysophospholipid acyltransferase family protein [Kiritimatiellia bacterium]